MRMARSGRLDLLMARYNAAHLGDEKEVFPVAQQLRLPVFAFTALRWGALIRPAPEEPPGTELPSPADCYRFVLEHPAVSVVLMAPGNRT